MCINYSVSLLCTTFSNGFCHTQHKNLKSFPWTLRLAMPLRPTLYLWTHFILSPFTVFMSQWPGCFWNMLASEPLYLHYLPGILFLACSFPLSCPWVTLPENLPWAKSLEHEAVSVGPFTQLYFQHHLICCLRTWLIFAYDLSALEYTKQPFCLI